MAENKLFDTGIKVTNGFSAAGAFPVDKKAIVETIAERDDHVTQNRAYDGMEVYVKEVEKKYRYRIETNEWIELDTDTTYGVGGEQLGLVKNGGNVHINSDGTMTASNKFKAQYNKSTWKDIDDAYLANKLIILEIYDIDGSGSSMYAYLSRCTNTQYMFTAIDITGVYQFTCDMLSGWSYESKLFVLASTSTEILTDISGNIVVDDNNIALSADQD